MSWVTKHWLTSKVMLGSAYLCWPLLHKCSPLCFLVLTLGSAGMVEAWEPTDSCLLIMAIRVWCQPLARCAEVHIVGKPRSRSRCSSRQVLVAEPCLKSCKSNPASSQEARAPFHWSLEASGLQAQVEVETSLVECSTDLRPELEESHPEGN